jgi:hypothetical protein
MESRVEEMSYGYIEEYFAGMGGVGGGMGQPETTAGRIGVVTAQFLLGAIAAGMVSPGEWRKSAAFGGLAAVAAGHIVETIFPFTGVLYYVRGIGMVPVGVGALVGLYHKHVLESEAISTLSWVKKLRTGEE